MRTLKEKFKLDRNIAVVSLGVFLFGLGEELWSQFRSLYLRALGADERIIGNFGTLKDGLDGVYQYPGGWVADHFGRRFALMLFGGMALLGYTIYLAAPTWPIFFLGLFFVMAWSSLAMPAIFATIGDSLPKGERVIGFTVQSVLKRVPSIIAPPLGGLLIDHLQKTHGQNAGLVEGVRIGLGVTIALALLTIWIQSWAYRETKRGEKPEFVGMRELFRSFHPSLRALLVSDIFVRTCEGMTEIFGVLYAKDIAHVTAAQFGFLISLAKITSILVYWPVVKLAGERGRKPFTLLTFTFFACFPLVIALSRSWEGLLFAYIIGGLREIGEPSRKSMILDFASPRQRGRTVGLYYFIRSISIAPAASIGGWLYFTYSPRLPFVIAFFFGLAGALIFSQWVHEEAADPGEKGTCEKMPGS